ncbi:hypothetical protein CLF_112960 [Clonorchis sinensis]|uniref:Uncharacterized protein n=1 Tax=Clonorchis sinensis TaxID=79923 RepID=G7YXC4_CLOSI|nr:hypothetical protein CLF_112960 [Clonorchis sinensis]
MARQYQYELAQLLSTVKQSRTGSEHVDEVWQSVTRAMLVAFSAVSDRTKRPLDIIETSGTDRCQKIHTSRKRVRRTIWRTSVLLIRCSRERARRLEREFTGRNEGCSNPTSAPQLPLSRLEQPRSIPALVPPSGGMAVRHRKGTTAE